MFFVILSVFALTVSVPIDRKRIKVNRPSQDEVFGVSRPKRHGINGGIKGGQSSHRSDLELKVTKGHYVCGNKICKLKPNVEPPGCNGICQYPVDATFQDSTFERLFNRNKGSGYGI